MKKIMAVVFALMFVASMMFTGTAFAGAKDKAKAPMSDMAKDGEKVSEDAKSKGKSAEAKMRQKEKKMKKEKKHKKDKMKKAKKDKMDKMKGMR